MLKTSVYKCFEKVIAELAQVGPPIVDTIVVDSRPLSCRNRRRRRIFSRLAAAAGKRIRLGRLSWKFILAAAAEKLYG